MSWITINNKQQMFNRKLFHFYVATASTNGHLYQHNNANLESGTEGLKCFYLIMDHIIVITDGLFRLYSSK